MNLGSQKQRNATAQNDAVSNRYTLLSIKRELTSIRVQIVAHYLLAAAADRMNVVGFVGENVKRYVLG